MSEKCWVCGKDIVESFGVMDIMSGRFCKKHWVEHTKAHKTTVSEYIKLKNMIMFERAMRKLESSGQNMTEVKSEAFAVRDHSADNPELYKSTDEIITAVILLHAGYDFEINFNVGKYIVDFYLPFEKLIVEVDGERHEHTALKDSKRDTELRRILGAEWEVIRIQTQYIEQDPGKIPEAITALAKQKRAIRKINGGFLPQNYSKREAAKYKDVMVYDEIHAKA